MQKLEQIKTIALLGSLVLALTSALPTTVMAGSPTKKGFYRDPYNHLIPNPYNHLHRDPYTDKKLPPPSPDVEETYKLLPSERLKFDTVRDNPVMEEMEGKSLNDRARFWRRKQKMKNRIANLAEDDTEEISSVSWQRFHQTEAVARIIDSREQNPQDTAPLWRRIQQLDNVVGRTNMQAPPRNNESSLWRTYWLAKQQERLGAQPTGSQKASSQGQPLQPDNATAMIHAKINGLPSLLSQKPQSQEGVMKTKSDARKKVSKQAVSLRQRLYQNRVINEDRPHCHDLLGNSFQPQCASR
jgi:hypothetical protein